MDTEFKIKDYFVVQRKMLRIGGLSLAENRSILYELYGVLLRILFIIYLFILIHDAFVNMDDFDIVVNSIYHAIAIIIGLSKITVVSLNKTKMDKTLKLLHEGVFAPNKERGGPIEETWIEECVRNSNLLIIVSWVLALTTLLISIIATMIKRITNSDPQHWELPFGEFSIFKPRRSPNYELAWLYQSIVFPMLAAAYLAADFLIISVFAHMSVQFKMLRNSINRIVDDDPWKMDENIRRNSIVTKQLQSLEPENVSWEFLACKLKDTVQYHLIIMDLARQLEETLNILVLVVYISVMVVLGCIMYHGSLYPPSDPRFQKDATMTMATSFQLFLISYFGNEVTLESQKVLSACFEPKFFDVDIRLQKSLGLIMARSLKPTKFTIGGFADLSLISFVAMARASFSYYMVLHSMNQ